MKEQPKRYVDRNGTKRWLLNGRRHREEGPAIEFYSGGKPLWLLHGEIVHPETLVDLWLSRGVFCYYDQETDTLHFAENE